MLPFHELSDLPATFLSRALCSADSEWGREGLLPRDSAPGARGRTCPDKAVPHSVQTQVMSFSKWNPLDYYGDFLELNFWQCKCLHARALCYPWACLCCCLCTCTWSHIAWLSTACFVPGRWGFGDSVSVSVKCVCKKQKGQWVSLGIGGGFKVLITLKQSPLTGRIHSMVFVSSFISCHWFTLLGEGKGEGQDEWAYFTILPKATQEEPLFHKRWWQWRQPFWQLF